MRIPLPAPVKAHWLLTSSHRAPAGPDRPRPGWPVGGVTLRLRLRLSTDPDHTSPTQSSLMHSDLVTLCTQARTAAAGQLAVGTAVSAGAGPWPRGRISEVFSVGAGRRRGCWEGLD